MMIKKIALAAMMGLLGTTAQATEDFQVEDIQIKGLQRVALGAALTHIPFNIGDKLNDFRISQSIKALYKSGHFNDIAIYREGNILIYRVIERATISEVTFKGNSDLKDEQLNESLDGQDIRVGETLDKTLITSIETGLEDFYHSVGKYNADVKVEITHLPRNRVNLHINFVEGKAAAIEQINVVGNEVFTDEELLERIELKFDSPWWDFMAADRYQKQTLQGDMETIKSFYLDRGYLQYKVDSTQVSMSPDQKAVYIALNVSEGEQYTVSEIEFVGDLAGFDNRIRRMSPLRAKRLYNGARVTYTEELISKFLGRYGYAYPKVVTIPEINEEDKTVKLSISVEPGKRIYVNRINFMGHSVTEDEVFRREMRQMEGAWLSNNLVEASKSRLQRLPYLENVEFETKQLPDNEDVVDIDFSLTEQPSGSFTAGVGYGSSSNLSLNAGIQQNNFLGTGNSLGLSVNTMSYSSSLTLSYTDPYFTVDAVSLGGQVYFTEFDAGNANLVDYNNTTYGVGVTFGFPINEYVRLTLGAGYKNNGITRLQTYEQIQEFYEIFSDPNNPDGKLKFESFDFTAALSRVTLNRGTFPTSGSSQRISAEITTPNSDVNYFKIDMNAKWYFPLSRDQRWTVLARVDAGYGNGYGDINGHDQLLPFWENFNAGGADTLRGFENNAVGPKAIYRFPDCSVTSPDGSQVCVGPDEDSVFTSERSVGGNAKLLAGLELIFPIPFLDESVSSSLRTSLFLDAGTVWDTEFSYDDYRDLDPTEFDKIDDFSDINRFRASAGLSLQWLSPMGPMIFSLARPLKEEDDDETKFFTFNIGQTF